MSPSAVPDHRTGAADAPPSSFARTAATGTLIAAVAIAGAGVAMLAALAVRLLVAGGERLTVEGPSLVLLVVGFGLACAVGVCVASRGWTTPRPVTLAFAVAATVAWPLSGHPWLGAPIAVLLVGLLLTRDRLQPTPARPGLDALLVLGLGGAVLMVAGAATARTTAVDPPAEVAQREAATDGGDGEAGDDAPAEADGDERDATRRGDETRRGGDDGERGGTATDDDRDVATRSDDAGSGGSPTSPAPAEAFVRGYYRDLNAQRFAEAWAKLAPAVRASLGPYARWKAGYAGTIGSRPHSFSVAGDSVTHLLAASDRGCGRERQFRVTWRLVRDGRRWTVTRLAAAPVGAQHC